MLEEKNDLIDYITYEEDLILNEIEKNSISGIKKKYLKKLHDLGKEYPCYKHGRIDLHKGSKERLYYLWHDISGIKRELQEDIERAYFRKKKSSKSKSKRKIIKK